jgi:hypothetical protein
MPETQDQARALARPKRKQDNALAVPVELLDELGVPEEDRLQFLLTLDKLARDLTASPQEELKWRLNAQLRGDNPGHPVNWRGLN